MVHLFSRSICAFVLSGACLSIPVIADDQSQQTTNNVIPISGPQAYSQETPVDAIVMDSDGNFHEEQYTYYPNYYSQDKEHPDPNVVIINNNNQVAQSNASIFFPLFAMGFIFAAGYWVGHSGNYWNGHNYVNVNVHNWNSQWNHHWNNWNKNWHNNWKNRSRNPDWHYRNNPNWQDRSGKQWRSGARMHEGRASGGHAGGGHR